MSGFLPTEVAGLGLEVGLLYALLAIGFVLVYKSTRVLNMAHGDIGGFGSVLLVYASLLSPRQQAELLGSDGFPQPTTRTSLASGARRR